MTLSRIKRYFTFSNVCAFVALAVALSGTAVAVAMITGAQIKNGTITGADIRNGKVAGIDIRNGSLGTTDLASASRTALQFPSVIPVGTTVRGSWGTQAYVVLGAGFYINIPLPAKAPTTLADTDINAAPGGYAGDSDATCTGTAAVPTAPSGKICIYQNYGGAGVAAYYGYALDNPYGFFVAIYSSANTTATLGGSWAYTA